MINIEKIRRKAAIDKVSISLVFKEQVHLIILEYLFRKGLFSELVFQGGTALRLVYQGVRYSEDLDFVLRKKNLPRFKNMRLELQPLASHIKKLIPFVSAARLKAQKETHSCKRYCLILETSFLNANDKTNIEIANIPSHRYQTMIIQYPGVTLSPAINVESSEEILSDKLLAFCARDYIKGRDIWDIYFIVNTLKVPINKIIITMLKKKISDYGLNKNKFTLLLKKRMVMLKDNGIQLLHEEMDRFLPVSYREAFKNKYSDICKDELNIFNELLKELKK